MRLPNLALGTLAVSSLLGNGKTTGPKDEHGSGNLPAVPGTPHKEQGTTSLLKSFFSNAGRGTFMRQVEFPGQVDALGNDVDFPMQNNRQPAGRAAQIFQKKFQDQVLKAPGTVFATRKDLGLGKNDVVMVDVGGEGQKTDYTYNLKSGNAHAINLNAQTTISSTPISINLEPDGKPVTIRNGYIPNLVRPAAEWPDKDYRGKLFPFADHFSTFTMMEGAPVYDYHVEELARITDRHGWISLGVSDDYESQIDRLAHTHNGGTVWKMETGDGFFRYVLPPASLAKREDAKSAFAGVNSHAFFEIAQVFDADSKRRSIDEL